ncbi:MAG: DUF2326 domain-containing protein [Oscillospiraceae bacterium]
MLIEVMCDKFEKNGKPRGRISLHKGLNIVMGTDVGSNSIGKSTFLMIIDFIFGGTDYVEKLTEVQTEIGEHKICFAFKFNGIIYYFSRSNVDFKYVQRCDSNYTPLENETMTLEQYCKFLQEQYDMSLEGLTFRNAVGRCMRIYKRNTLDVEFPLQQAKKEKMSDGILGLLKLTNLYADVEAQSKITKEAREKHTAFKNAKSFSYIPSVKNQTEFKNNCKRIDELITKSDEIAEKTASGVLEIDTFQADKFDELQQKLKELKRQRRKTTSQIKAIQADYELGNKTFKHNYVELETFFPNVDMRRIEAIEEFHKKLSGILKTEFTDTIEHLKVTLSIIDEEIKKVEEDISQITKVTTLSKAVLEEYASISKELKHLQQANDNFNTEKQLAQTAKEYEKVLNNLIMSQLATMQQKINEEMSKINTLIYNKQKTSPILHIDNSKKYSFSTPKDGGTGTEYRGLVVFDLALLSLTKLPVIAHDSVLLKQIEDYAIEKILEIYSNSDKQIFIALDKMTSYSQTAQQIMEKSTILKLSSDKGALFGREWNSTDET